MTEDPNPQADKFRDLARQLGTDDDEKAFEERVRAVVKTPNSTPKPKDN